MKAPCVAAVRQAIGRDITQNEAKNIETRIRDTMKRFARQDPDTWASLSHEERLTYAATLAAKDLVDEAKKKRVRIAQTIVAHDRIDNYTKTQVAAGHDKTRLDALSRLLVGKNDGRNNVASVDSQIHGTFGVNMGRLVDLWQAVHPRFFGIFRNKEAEELMYKALHGDKNVPPEIAKGAAIFKDKVAEPLRQRANAAGFDIGKRDDWGTPHSHSDRLFLKAGEAAVVNDFMKWVDREQYVHEDGRRYSDDEMREFLSHAYKTVVTDGANKSLRTDIPGGSIKGNRHSMERQIHFKDPESALQAFSKYTDKNLFQVISDHVHSMARDIALVETLGPNSDLTMKHFTEKLNQEATVTDPEHKGRYEQGAADTLNLYDYLAGNYRQPGNAKVARVMTGMRQWLSSVMLGSAPITALSDEGLLHRTAFVNDLPPVKVFTSELRALNPLDRQEKKLAMRSGLMIETMIHELNRFSADTVGPSIPSKVSAVFMRASGLIKLDEMRRRTLMVPLLDHIGELSKRGGKLADLDPHDAQNLQQSGLTENDWRIMQLATPERWGGKHTVMTADAISRIDDAAILKVFPDANPQIMREQAMTRLLGFAHEQANKVVPIPTARQRSLITQGAPAGTWRGEIMRSLALFRSFPFSYFEQHFKEAWNRYDSMPGKLGFTASLIATQTIFGAMAMEINDIVSGKNPRALFGGNNLTRNWLAAFAKGGALGVYGDYLFSDPNTGGRGVVEGLTGAFGAEVEDLDRLTRGNILKLMQGQKTEAGSEAVKFARSYLVPGANLWYTKAVTDHAIFHELQEFFSPGYLARQASRAQSLYGTDYWWRPGQPLSEAQAPNLATVAGHR